MTKESRVFEAFMRGGSYNHFEAARQLHDHCLHSTVATLERKHQITINRIPETARGFMGQPTRVCRYWIERKERTRIIDRRKQAIKEAANATDQDKESGCQSNAINPTDELGSSQTHSGLNK